MPHSTPKSTLFPYTTLFRSLACRSAGFGRRRGVVQHTVRPIGVSVAARERSRQSGGLCVERLRGDARRSEEHTSQLQSQFHLVCRLLLEKKNKKKERCEP